MLWQDPDLESSDSSSDEIENRKVTDLADLLWHKIRKPEQSTEPRREQTAQHGTSSIQPSSSKTEAHYFHIDVSKLLKKKDKQEAKKKPTTLSMAPKFASPLKAIYGSGKALKHLEKIKRVDEPCISEAERKKQAKLARSQWSLGKEQWGSMRMEELTEERKQDLMMLNMRATVDPTRHYKHGDVKTPKFFQIGTVQEDHFSHYHDRIPKKKRKRTLVEELMADDEFKRKLKRQYNDIKEVKKKGKALFQGKAPRKIKRKK